MAELSAFVPIESRHGDDCTCPPAGRITLDLVKATPACTGDRSPGRNRVPRDGEPCGPLPYPGRVIITLPGEYPAWWQIAVHDKDTGDLLPVGAFNLGFDHERGKNTDPMTVTLRLLVDEEDRPLHVVAANGSLPQPRREADGSLRARIFRCPIAEMRTVPANDGEGAPPQADSFGGDIATLRKGDEFTMRGASGAPVLVRVASVNKTPDGRMEANVEPVPNEDGLPPLPEGHEHVFLSGPVGLVSPCSCGRTRERHEKLLADEAAGIRYLNETAQSVDEYGRAKRDPMQ